MATTTLTVDLNGTILNNTLSYDDSTTPNPASLLFANAAVTTTGGPNAQLTSLQLNLSGPSTTETLALNAAAAATASTAKVTFSYNATTGVGTFAYTGTGSGPSDATWNTILRGVTYKNTADEANGASHTITLSGASSHGGAYATTTLGTDTITVTCFLAGTLIRTPDGEVAVETLKRGDLVVASDGRCVPVTWLGVQTISRRFAAPMRSLPIRIKAGALGENIPSRDLRISPDHAILVDGTLIHAGALVNGSSITRETDMPETFSYYHVEADDHWLILAENTPAETFIDNVDRLNFDNWAEHQALYPEGKEITELPYPRAKARRQVPVNIRVRLADRALAIGADAMAVAVA
jgi:hypothetical protein